VKAVIGNLRLHYSGTYTAERIIFIQGTRSESHSLDAVPGNA
jgi:hypothetical protein